MDAENLTLIRVIPCFSFLTDQQCRFLLSLMHHQSYPPGSIIVKENELVDSIFIIISGKLEVSVRHHKLGKSVDIPVAILEHGETIGLNDSGFFSTTGKRTATVKSLTEVTLLSIDIQALTTFLAENQLQNDMYESSKKMLYLSFIKKSLPFSKLSTKRLNWLLKRIEEISMPKGGIIFQQGEVGDKCYLICSGSVIISVEDAKGTNHILAHLSSPSLFGEATLLTHLPRNATAIAETDVTLLALSKDYVSELIETEQNVANTFMGLMIDRSLPIQSIDVSEHQQVDTEGNQITILKNNSKNTYFQLSPEGQFIWHQLDGEHSLQDLTLSLADKFNIFAPNIVAALISKLYRSGFIENLHLEDIKTTKTKWHVRWYRFKNMLHFRKSFGDANEYLTNLYRKYFRFLFKPIAQAIFAIIALTGFILFVDYTPTILVFFNFQHASLLLILTLIPLSMLEAILHEIGHAFAVKRFGREVHYMGIGWDWFKPIVFTDTSDMWIAAPRDRIIVNLAGVYVDVIIAGMISLLILAISNPYLQAVMWLYALYTYLKAVHMLSPLQNADGYYALMDFVRKPHLRKSAVKWLLRKFPKALRNPKLFLENGAEVTYWAACIVYLIVISLITLIIQTFVLIIFEINSPSKYFNLILPFLVVVFSSLNIIWEIRKEDKTLP